jgi:hypothetical protein
LEALAGTAPTGFSFQLPENDARTVDTDVVVIGGEQAPAALKVQAEGSMFS